MTKRKSPPEKYIIRNATLRIYDYFFLISTVIFLVIVINGSQGGWPVFALFGLVFFTAYRIFKRVQDRSAKIIIDKNGINLCTSNEFISWSKIKYAYVKLVTQGVGKNAKVVEYFYVDTEDRETKVNMADFNYNKGLLAETVEYHSGRNIGEITDLLSDRAKEIIGSDRNLNEISKIMTDFYKRQDYIGLISLFTLIGISVYLQVVIDYPYVFAIGFSVTLGIIGLIDYSEQYRLRNQAFISELSEEKFNAVKHEYGKGIGTTMSKKKKLFGIIFLSIVALGLFVISYILEKSERNDNEQLNRTQIENSLHNNGS